MTNSETQPVPAKDILRREGVDPTAPHRRHAAGDPEATHRMRSVTSRTGVTSEQFVDGSGNVTYGVVRRPNGSALTEGPVQPPRGRGGRRRR